MRRLGRNLDLRGSRIAAVEPLFRMRKMALPS